MGWVFNGTFLPLYLRELRGTQVSPGPVNMGSENLDPNRHAITGPSSL
jgi:hypothetical protein